MARTNGAADLSRMSRKAADLSRTSVPDHLRVKAMRNAEEQLGMRCGGCGERITTGFSFTALEPVMNAGGVVVQTLKLAACNGENGCEFAPKCREGATTVEMIEFVWLDAEPAVEPEADADTPAG